MILNAVGLIALVKDLKNGALIYLVKIIKSQVRCIKIKFERI